MDTKCLICMAWTALRNMSRKRGKRCWCKSCVRATRNPSGKAYASWMMRELEGYQLICVRDDRTQKLHRRTAWLPPPPSAGAMDYSITEIEFLERCEIESRHEPLINERRSSVKKLREYYEKNRPKCQMCGGTGTIWSDRRNIQLECCECKGSGLEL